MAEVLDDLFELIAHPSKQVALRAFDLMLKMPEDEFVAGLQAEGCAKAKLLFSFFSRLDVITQGLLDVLTVSTSTEDLTLLALNEEKLVRKVLALARHGETKEFVLPMTQMSRAAPKAFHERLYGLVGNYSNLLHDTFQKCHGGKANPIVLLNVAYVFMNVTQDETASIQLFGDSINGLTSYLSKPDVSPGFKRIVAKTLLNISCHIKTHPMLLNDPHIVADIVTPFADEDDDIESEEMEKLPINLQYVSQKRSTCTDLLDTLVEVLAQLCTTKDGRTKLRHWHIYVVLREFDKSRRRDEPKVEERFMTLDGSPEWNLLMNTLLFDDAELNAPDDDELVHGMRELQLREIRLDELDEELKLIEAEVDGQRQKDIVHQQPEPLDEELSGGEAALLGPSVGQESRHETKKRRFSETEINSADTSPEEVQDNVVVDGSRRNSVGKEERTTEGKGESDGRTEETAEKVKESTSGET